VFSKNEFAKFSGLTGRCSYGFNGISFEEVYQYAANFMLCCDAFASWFGSFLLLFFWLDPKEPKGQDLPKLQLHKAERWLAGKSAHRTFPICTLWSMDEIHD
jgi:hypothetical protein